MQYDNLKLFLENKLTVDQIIAKNIEHFGASLYPYQIYLTQQERKSEVALIEDIRNKIFSWRNKFQVEFITTESLGQLITAFRITYDQLNIIKTMLEASSTTKWEAQFFYSDLNEMSTYIHFLQDYHTQKKLQDEAAA